MQDHLRQQERPTIPRKRQHQSPPPIICILYHLSMIHLLLWMIHLLILFLHRLTLRSSILHLTLMFPQVLLPPARSKVPALQCPSVPLAGCATLPVLWRRYATWSVTRWIVTMEGALFTARPSYRVWQVCLFTSALKYSVPPKFASRQQDRRIFISKR